MFRRRPAPEIDGVRVGKLTRREKELLKRMDKDDKHDSKRARKDTKPMTKRDKANAKAARKKK